jgi:transcriptional regulator GlxA family with amidase domain
MLLAAAGITTGRPATTHHSAVEDLRASGAHVVAARVVDDGDVVTAGGVTSGIDLALLIVERQAGPDIARRVAHEIEYVSVDSRVSV